MARLPTFQEQVLNDFRNNRFSIINKSRQLGISTLVAGFALWYYVWPKADVNKDGKVDSADAAAAVTKVADWYGAHGDTGNVPGGNQYPISLTAGTYSVKVRLQERNGSDIVNLLYSSDSGSTWNIIPDNWFPLNVTGTTGSYTNIVAQGTGSGENATFDVEVIGGLVDSVVLSNGGGSYLVGEILTISGSTFGSTEDITITVDSVYSDDVIVTVTGVGPNPSVYEHYTCQIFERQGGDKRLSFYDSNDILTIKNINDITITYTAGYGTEPSGVPMQIRQAVLMMVADGYDNREDYVKKLPTASEYLLDQYRVQLF